MDKCKMATCPLNRMPVLRDAASTIQPQHTESIFLRWDDDHALAAAPLQASVPVEYGHGPVQRGQGAGCRAAEAVDPAGKRAHAQAPRQRLREAAAVPPDAVVAGARPLRGELQHDLLHLRPRQPRHSQRDGGAKAVRGVLAGRAGGDTGAVRRAAVVPLLVPDLDRDVEDAALQNRHRDVVERLDELAPRQVVDVQQTSRGSSTDFAGVTMALGVPWEGGGMG
eukprot:CAMPEP_0204520706 /NCGR_PEP_ID=MMETSP0661-20131031/5403_1 /ASSEMBLY_ACC=CAM_ASM_000606 /TAXON_ID=109239 /ORGANISM="Alexandrium margalefi, Strain AMGDE01CS-322" /LENGTH=223 /DNA_ID=CAMNT_0051526273 /DNA_START=10 /DNA_END=678 /DNA_ORIENTATION=-